MFMGYSSKGRIALGSVYEHSHPYEIIGSIPIITPFTCGKDKAVILLECGRTHDRANC